MAIELQWDIECELTELKPFLDRVCNACLKLEGIDKAAVGIRIVDDNSICALNLETRGIDRPTDVLSFPTVNYRRGTTARDNAKRLRREYDPAFGCPYLGDCIISLDRAKAQAEEFGHSLSRELGYLTAHSIFHLLGYDHMTSTDKEAMRAMEKQTMQLLDLPRDHADHFQGSAMEEIV